MASLGPESCAREDHQFSFVRCGGDGGTVVGDVRRRNPVGAATVMASCDEVDPRHGDMAVFTWERTVDGASHTSREGSHG